MNYKLQYDNKGLKPVLKKLLKRNAKKILIEEAKDMLDTYQRFNQKPPENA